MKMRVSDGDLESVRVHLGGAIKRWRQAATLLVGDDGVGLATGLEWQNSASLGLRIVRILTMQSGQQIG